MTVHLGTIGNDITLR